MAEHGLKVLDHPPYSPDVVPSDFRLKVIVKEKLKGIYISGLVDLEGKVREILADIPVSILSSLHTEWLKRLEWVSLNGGEYYHK